MSTTAPRVLDRPTGVRAGWSVPVALIALSLIPVTAGTLRLVQLAGGPSPMPVDDRFGGVPVALVAHILGAATYAVLGAFQFVAVVRRRHPGWHRRTGRVLGVAGMTVVASAVWITLTYEAQPGTGPVLYVVRLLVAPAMGAALVLGFTAIRRRDVTAHRAWMIRAYALGLGAGTQAFTEGIGVALVGTGEVRTDLAKTAGWVVNVAVAEWAVRRGRTS
jgi:uncharacterized membrane protein